MSCPDLLVLSQLTDDELPETERASMRAHVSTCTACADRIARLATAVAAVKGAAAAAPAGTSHDGARASGCPSESQLVGWLDPAAPAGERRAASLHLDRCDDCLGEVVRAARLMERLDATPPVPVPAALIARVASRWPVPEPSPSLATLVIQVTRSGVRLLEKHLVEPWRDLAELAAPAPVFRAAVGPAELRFQLVAAETRISATVVPAGDAVGLVLALEEATGERLADQRIFLRHRGRSIFSARTDAEGVLRTPRLERGVYEVSCPGIGTSFRLDLRG